MSDSERKREREREREKEREKDESKYLEKVRQTGNRRHVK